MVEAWKEDIHGGNNKHGIEVKCVDCHLPHDSLVSYLITKMETGLHDVYAQNVYDLEKIDWNEKRKHREHFVYDSACLACHTNLKDATMSNLKAFKGHKAYFSGTTEKKCVSCHENIGHKNLGDYLPKK
jgi:cytochrome c-type protein NapC